MNPCSTVISPPSHKALPHKLYTSEQTRQLDNFVIQQLGVPAAVLMKRAGRALFDYATGQWPEASRWLVLCGGGNNGGDGYVFAALAAQRAQPVVAFAASPPENLKGAAKLAYAYALQEGVQVKAFNELEATEWLDASAVVVDALLGTGLSGPVKTPYTGLIHWLNRQSAPVLSADIPSGLCANSGAEQGVSVRATATVTFIGVKAGLLTGRGPARAGSLSFSDLGVPSEAYDQVPHFALRCAVMASPLRPRAADAHKGCFGHVLVVGGDRGFGGAAMLASETAALAGAGLVGLATQPDHVSAALVRRPEVMTLAVPSGQELEPHLHKPSVIVVGPGLGQTPWSEQMLQQVLQACCSDSAKALILDADALNILAAGKLKLSEGCGDYILTPHPGEAARLLGCSVAQVEANRFDAVSRLQKSYGGVVVLKGAGTLICDGKELWLANVGNPALATGGSGDVLSGLLGSLLAQGVPALQAAKYGVCLHGKAADLALQSNRSDRLLSSELMPFIRAQICL